MSEKNLEENISETILEKEKEQPPNKEDDASSPPSSSAPKEKEKEKEEREKEAEASLSQSADKAITLPPRKNSTASEPINNNKQFEEWEREDPMEGVLFNLQRNDTRLTSFDGRYFASLIPENEEAKNEKEGEGEEDDENERKKNEERRDELLNRLFSSLESNTNLKRLSLMGAKLEDRHAEALSRSLRQNTGLVLLDLSFNRIGEKGARHLLECLSSSSPNRHLRQLFLWGNRPLSTSSNETKDEEQEKELMIRPETEQEIMRCLRRNREMALHRNDSSEHHHHFSSLEDATEKEEGKGSWILRSLESPQHQPEEDLPITTEVEEPVKEKEKEKAWTKKSVSYIAKMGTSGGTGLLAKLREASGSNKEHQHGDDAATDDSDSSTNHRRKRSFTTDESKSSPTVLPPLTLSTSANNASSKESNNNIPVTPPPTPKSGATSTRPVSSHSLFEGLSAGSNIRTRNSTSTAISPRGSSSSPSNNNNNVPLKKKERKERYEKEMEKGQEKILKLKQKYRESERSQLELRQFNEQLSERIEELQQYIEDMQEGKGLWLPSSALSAKAASPYPSVHQFPSLPSVVHPPQQRNNNIEQQRLSAPSSPLIQRSASSTRSASFNSSPLKPPSSSSSSLLPRSSLSADEIRGNAEEGENENETTMTLDNLSSEEVALPPSRKRRSLVGGSSSSSSPSSSSSSSAKDIKRRTSASSLIQQFEQMSSPDSSDEDGAPSNHSKRKHAHTVSTTSPAPSPSKGSTRVGTLRKTASKASFQKGWGALKKGFKGENKHNEEAGNVVAAAEKSSASTSSSLGVAAGKKASAKAKTEKNKGHSKKENKSPQDKNASSAQPTVSAPTTIVHHSSSGPSSPSLASSSPTAEGKGVGLNASSSVASSPLFASFFGGQQQHKSSMPINPQQPRFVGTVVIGRKLSESELTCKAIEHEEKKKEDEEEKETEEDEDKSISAKVIEYDCLVEGWNCVMRELRDVLLFTGKRADKVGALRFAVWKLEVLPYHSNLVRYFLHREYENSFYLYSQRHGIPLSDYLRQKKQSEDAGFSMEELLRYCTNLVEALHYLHSMDYVLKALRPEHVYVTLNQKNEIALLSVDPMEGFIDDLRTSSSYVISAYTAPELLKETDKAPTPEMNVWCLGMLLYELLTLDIPWENESQESIKEKLLAGESPSLPNELKPLPEVVPQHIALTEDASSSSSTSSSEEKPEEQEEKEKQNEGEQEEKQEGEQPKKKEEPVEEQAPVVMVGRKEKTERKRVEKLVDLFHNMTALDPTKRPSLDKVQLYLNLCGAL